jgi:iron complex outermembrane receptor protein
MLLVGSSLAVAIPFHSVAFAQQAEKPDSAATPAQGLEEIIVTARKVSESAQETPIAIAAFTPEEIAASQIRSVVDLGRTVPGFSALTVGPDRFNTAISLRGIATVNTQQMLDSPVAIYVDGVYQGPSGAALPDQYDISQITVSKGPQGTLFGRNSTGGAIQIEHNRPTDQFEGWVKAGVGTFSTIEGAGMLNVPLGADAALRVVGGYQENGGFGRNLVDGKPRSDLQAWNVLGSLRYQPSDKLDILLRGLYFKGTSKGASGKGAFMLPGSTSNIEVAAELFPTFLPNLAALRQGGGDRVLFGQQLAAARAAYLADATNANFEDSRQNVDQFNNARKSGTSLTVNYELNDDVELKSITAYQYAERNVSVDLDASSFAIANGAQSAKEKQFTEEVTLSGRAFDGNLKYVAGLYYFHKNADELLGGRFLPALTGVPGGAPNFFPNEVRVRSFAPYAQGTYALTQSLNLTAGLRWTSESKRGIFTGAAPYDQTTKFKQFAYTASLDYSPAQGTMLYVTTGRSFRGGGLQETAGVPAPFKPEIVISYEAGIKADLFDRKVRFNVAAYHLDYSDLQQTIWGQAPNGLAAISIVANAGAAKIDGVEVDLAAKLGNLTLGASGAYTNPRYTKFVNEGQDISSFPVQNVAKWSYVLNGDYRAPMKGGQVALHVDWHWQSDVGFTATPTLANAVFDSNGVYVRPLPINNVTGQTAYGILNGRMSFTLDAAGVNVAFWARNIANRKYLTSGADLAGTPKNPAFGFVFISTNYQPQTFGVEFTKKF